MASTPNRVQGNVLDIKDQRSTTSAELTRTNTPTQIQLDSEHSKESSNPPSKDIAPSKPSWSKRILDLLREQWFLIGIAVVILIASQVQVTQQNQDLKRTVVTYLCVSIIFFLTGCTLKTRTLLENYGRWKLHLFVQVQCYLMTSAVIFGIVSAAATNPDFMDPGLLLGFILCGCVATTISSNVVMTGQAHGNQALTVVQSTLGNFLAPFLTPALFAMYTSTGAWYTEVLPNESGEYGQIYKRVFKQLGLSIFLPIVVGQVVQNLFPGPTKKVCTDWKLKKAGSFCLLVIIWQTYDSAFSSGAFTSVKGSNMLFIVFMSVACFLLFLGIGFFTALIWLPKEDVCAVCYCVPAKSPAVGVPLATVMFIGISPMLEAKLQIPLVIFQGLQIAGGSLMIVPFRKWIEKSGKVEDSKV